MAVGSGKDGNIYVLDRDNMGKFNASQDNICELISSQLAGGEYAKPSYFNPAYYGAVGDALKAFAITNARPAPTPSSQSSNSFPYPGTTPNISANGIVWAVQNCSTAVLYAYDATKHLVVGGAFATSTMARRTTRSWIA